jgi:hypothetical protein
LLACLAFACDKGDDGSDPDTGMETADEGGDTTETGSNGINEGPYWPCDGAGECFQHEENNWCIEPGDGSGLGFCTIDCGAPGDCQPHPEGTATVDCIVASTDPVCVLDCETGECPDGMFCKLLATGEGARSLCFNELE